MNSEQLTNLFQVFGSTITDSLNRDRHLPVIGIIKIPIDMINDEKNIFIYAELPGVNKEKIVIDFYNNKLSIKAEKELIYDSPDVAEIKHGRYERVITLPVCVTSNRAVSVNFTNGILQIKIDKLVEEENKFSVKLD